MSEFKTIETQFLYSQDLSNYKTTTTTTEVEHQFLYSQDLSNYKTASSF